jgi:hypothetical protein
MENKANNVKCKELKIYKKKGVEPYTVYGVIKEEDSEKVLFMTGNGNITTVLKDFENFVINDTNKDFVLRGNDDGQSE